jgi:TonB family protein
VQSRLTLREGDTLDRDASRRLNDELVQIDEHLTTSVRGSGSSDAQRAGIILRIMLRSTAAQPATAASVSVNEGVSAPQVISRVPPEYTEQARQAKWQGTVGLQVIVNEMGIPQEIKIVRPLGMGLDQKAIEAVQQWRFQPGLKDGKPVPVTANLELNFRLQ